MIESPADASVARVKPALPGGFLDHDPGTLRERLALQRTVVDVFERYGFVPLETSIVEFREVLFGEGGETDKQIFDIAVQGDDKPIALRYDLTVGFSRYVAAHPELTLPFKRWQIGDVFRGEKPQLGRFRQFKQFDADIVGTRSPAADAEIVACMHDCLDALGVADYRVRVNHRGVLGALARALGVRGRDDLTADDAQKSLMRSLDKLDKIGFDGVAAELTRAPRFAGDTNLGLSPDALGGLSRYLALREITRIDDAVPALTALLGDALDAGTVADLTRFAASARAHGLVRGGEDRVAIDLTIARGLDYYTGIVFETRLAALPEYGSVMSGGRYDGLVARYQANSIPAVGGSIGFDRLYAALTKLGLRGGTPAAPQVVVLALELDRIDEIVALTQTLRAAGIIAEAYLGEERSFKAQFNFAVKRQAAFAVIRGDRERAAGESAVKNLAARTQETVRDADLPAYLLARLRT